ncbi:MAG TPA: prolipoprotein diacylglyceryl transferase [Tissierellaceae bacterium]
MNPVAFTIFGVDVYWYGILIALAVLVGTVIGLQAAKRKGIEEETLLDLLLYAIPLSIIGARIYYVIFSWDMYKDNISKVFDFRSGGLAIHGGIIAAIIVGYLFSKKRNVSFWVLADIAAPSMILGQSIGRWGNYINGEAHGGPTDLPWGIIVDGVKVHPTFLYESIWNFFVFLFLLWLSRNKSKTDGEIFLLYLILYSVARFFIEGLRTDSLMWGSVRVAQLISILIIVVAGLILYKKKNK